MGKIFRAGLYCLGLSQAVLAQTSADSGWTNLFNGTNFNGLYVYAKATTNGQAGYGRVTIAQDSARVRIANQTTAMFQVDTGKTIKVGGSGVPNGYIGTIRQYSYYHVRVQYMWPTGTAATANAGLLINLDSASLLSSSYNTTNNRPQSIEVNMKRDGNDGGDPFTLWSAASLGPYITTRVVDSVAWKYSPTGIVWTDNPWGNRTIYSTVPNPEKPLGQWNQGEAYMYGADSGTFILNGVVRTKGWNFQTRVNPNNPTPRVAYSRGNIGLQSEGSVIYYRNFQIQILDSATGKPVALLNQERNRKLTGRELMVKASGERWIDIPKGYSGLQLYNLRGRLVWSFRGSDVRAVVPVDVEKGILRARFLTEKY